MPASETVLGIDRDRIWARRVHRRSVDHGCEVRHAMRCGICKRVDEMAKCSIRRWDGILERPSERSRCNASRLFVAPELVPFSQIVAVAVSKKVEGEVGQSGFCAAAVCNERALAGAREIDRTAEDVSLDDARELRSLLVERCGSEAVAETEEPHVTVDEPIRKESRVVWYDEGRGREGNPAVADAHRELNACTEADAVRSGRSCEDPARHVRLDPVLERSRFARRHVLE